MKKILLRMSVVLLILGIIIGVIIVEFIAPYAVVMPQKIDLVKNKDRFYYGAFPEEYKLKTVVLDIVTKDSFVLSNYLALSAQDTSKGTMIMLHGIGGCKEDYLGIAKSLTDSGYNCLIYDARAHGQSGGEHCTIGYREKEDVQAVVSAILEYDSETSVGIWASSMGAAVALQALAIEPRIKFGVIESTFTELSEIVYQYQKRYCCGIGLRFASNRTLTLAGRIANFDPYKIQPIKICGNIKQPILMNHGDADQHIPIRYGKQLFEALGSADKTFYTVKGAGHTNLYTVGGKSYYENTLNFIAAHF
ncbi:MAG: alpha/beta fold hydrolase [Aureispira sp.]|nr:alpha/beta fold hydrolase [Aureispira sp.]